MLLRGRVSSLKLFKSIQLQLQQLSVRVGFGYNFLSSVHSFLFSQLTLSQRSYRRESRGNWYLSKTDTASTAAIRSFIAEMPTPVAEKRCDGGGGERNLRHASWKPRPL